MEYQKDAHIQVIFGLTLIHFIGDFYSSFINPLLPVFVEQFSLTLAQVGVLVGISRLMAFIVQPAVGYVADHYKTRFFVLGGPILTIVFISLLGVAPSFSVLLIFVSLGSIGSSMFHPTTAGMISEYSGRHFAFCMSIFNAGGTFAFAVGPVFITYLVGAYGLQVSPLAMIIGFIVMIYLFKTIPVPVGESLKDFGFIGSLKEALGMVWKSIVLIWIIMVLRAFVGISFRSFITVLFAQEGYTLVSIGVFVSVFTVAGSFSGLLAGHLSDRIGYKPIFYFSHGLATPCLILLLYVQGGWIYLAAFMAGFLSMATLPLGVAMAQELAPKGKSMVSSLMMGFAFGLGGIMAPITGEFADVFTIRPVLFSISIIPLLTIGLIYMLPKKNLEKEQESA
jgi:MFS transporter, FSR family, fosmidomycin resistance protein